jgi:hypothetical protein
MGRKACSGRISTKIGAFGRCLKYNFWGTGTRSNYEALYALPGALCELYHYATKQYNSISIAVTIYNYYVYPNATCIHKTYFTLIKHYDLFICGFVQ